MAVLYKEQALQYCIKQEPLGRAFMHLPDHRGLVMLSALLGAPADTQG